MCVWREKGEGGGGGYRHITCSLQMGNMAKSVRESRARTVVTERLAHDNRDSAKPVLAGHGKGRFKGGKRKKKIYKVE